MSYEQYYTAGFGKYPKAKYILYIDGNIRYSFITTSRDEPVTLSRYKILFT